MTDREQWDDLGRVYAVHNAVKAGRVWKIRTSQRSRSQAHWRSRPAMGHLRQVHQAADRSRVSGAA